MTITIVQIERGIIANHQPNFIFKYKIIMPGNKNPIVPRTNGVRKTQNQKKLGVPGTLLSGGILMNNQIVDIKHIPPIIVIHHAAIFVFIGKLISSIILCKLFSVLISVILIFDF